MSEIKQVTCFSVREWRNWLERNHLEKERVMLVRYKLHTGKGTFNQREAMDEAICFGWIDTTLRRLDDERYGVTFVKRKKTSKWSDNTFRRARKMIKLGKMSDFGREMYKLGLKSPPHNRGIPKNPGMPLELKKELDKKKNKKARENFEKLAPSYKRTYFRWILSGKMEETRKRRVKQTIDMARKNLKPGTLKKDM